MTREELLKDLELSDKATLETLPLNKSRSWAMSEQKDWAWIAEIEKEAKQTMATMYAMHEEGSKFWGQSQKPRALNELKLISAVRQMKIALEKTSVVYYEASSKITEDHLKGHVMFEPANPEKQKIIDDHNRRACLGIETLARLAKGDFDAD